MHSWLISPCLSEREFQRGEHVEQSHGQTPKFRLENQRSSHSLFKVLAVVLIDFKLTITERPS